MTAVMKKKINGIFIDTLKIICVPNFSSVGWFLFSSAVISCHQLSWAVNSCWQLSPKKIKWNFHPYPKSYMCAKFQLSRMIFIFISCQQLLSAVGSCSDVEIYFWELDSHIGPKVYSCAKFQLSRLILIAVNCCHQLSTAVDSWWWLS